MIQQLRILVLTQMDGKLKSTQNLHTNIYSSFSHNCQHSEATKMPSSSRMDKYTAVHPDNATLFSTKRKWDIEPYKDMEETELHSTTWKMLILSVYMLDASNHMTFSKRQTAKTRKGPVAVKGYGGDGRGGTQDF